MYDRGKVVAGIVVFLVFFTSPFLLGLVRHGPAPKPELTPKAKEAGRCIEATDFMKANHMRLLDDWRNQVVREGNRIYTAASGTTYLASLQNTCMECHSNKSKFCDQCHNYMGVSPYCWDCHVEPKEKKE